MDEDTLYSDTVLGDLAWRSAGDMALGFAKYLGAKPEPLKPVETKPAEPGPQGPAQIAFGRHVLCRVISPRETSPAGPIAVEMAAAGDHHQ